MGICKLAHSAPIPDTEEGNVQKDPFLNTIFHPGIHVIGGHIGGHHGVGHVVYGPGYGKKDEASENDSVPETNLEEEENTQADQQGEGDVQKDPFLNMIGIHNVGGGIPIDHHSYHGDYHGHGKKDEATESNSETEA